MNFIFIIILYNYRYGFIASVLSFNYLLSIPDFEILIQNVRISSNILLEENVSKSLIFYYSINKPLRGY